ncbi:MAG: hypothetical protein U5J98_07745 [Halobacteriales archaeon]|nr:hypothetical protein [Halobacteriales archaeon]
MSVRLPTRAADWRLMGRTARLVLGLPAYAGVALAASLVGLTAFVVTQNLALVGDVVVGGALPLENRLAVLLGLYPFLGTSFSLVQGLALLVIAGLLGVDLAMVAYHFREHGLSLETGGGSAVGALLGTLGAGCAACGPAVLVGLLSLFGAAGALTLLPFEGLELTGLAAVALLLSIFWLADGMRGGMIRGCPVDLPR